MKTKLLLPNRYKLIGWMLLIPATILGIMVTTFNWESQWLQLKVFALFDQPLMGKFVSCKFIETNMTLTLTGLLFIIGAMLVAFSKEKQEDEYIAELRLSSLLWAVLVNYILLFVSFAFVYDGAFFVVMIYNMFTVLIIFIVRFNYMLYKNAKLVSDEKQD